MAIITVKPDKLDWVGVCVCLGGVAAHRISCIINDDYDIIGSSGGGGGGWWVMGLVECPQDGFGAVI